MYSAQWVRGDYEMLARALDQSLVSNEKMIAMIEDKKLDLDQRQQLLRGLVENMNRGLKIAAEDSQRETIRYRTLELESPWWYVSAALHYLGGLALLVAGIGVMLLEGWGRRVVVGVAIFETLQLAVEVAIFAFLPSGRASDAVRSPASPGSFWWRKPSS